MTAFHERPSTGPTAARAAAMQALVPMIETDRLILRAPRIEDFDDFAEIVLGPQGLFYGKPTSRDAAWSDFMQITGTWYLRGHGAWTVTRRDGGDVLGFFHIGAEPGDEAPEIGFLLAAKAQGKGYGTEAAAAIRDHGFGPMGLKQLVSYVDAGNARSLALATRLGADREDRVSDSGEAYSVFHHRPSVRSEEKDK